MTKHSQPMTQAIQAISVFLLRPAQESQEVLLLRRAPDDDLPGIWCEVAGGVDPGESAWQAALREVQEETGLTPSGLYSADTCASFYDYRQDKVETLPVFVGLIEAQAEVVLNHEHSEFAWFSLEAALELLPFPAQRRVLREIWESFVQRPPQALLQIPLPE